MEHRVVGKEESEEWRNFQVGEQRRVQSRGRSERYRD